MSLGQHEYSKEGLSVRVRANFIDKLKSERFNLAPLRAALMKSEDDLEGLEEWVTISALEVGALQHNARMVAALHVLLQDLASAAIIEFASATGKPKLTLLPISHEFYIDHRPIDIEKKYLLSRFAYVRSHAGALVIETPLGHARVTIEGGGLGLLSLFQKGASALDLQELLKSSSVNEQSAIVHILRDAKIIESSEYGSVTNEESRALQQWEFHDLLFHSRSRLGKHDYLMGGTFRFKGEIAPLPALKRNPWEESEVYLPRPETSASRQTSPFFEILEHRRSIRNQGWRPILLAQLSEFLYRSARVRSVVQTPSGEFSSRPYPNGGASYELELYLTVDRCDGLARGFYYYDPLKHSISLISAPTQDMEMMLRLAFQSSAGTCRPQVLITVASRFQRVSWKYSGIAYATQLKNVGALYSTFYLVATAMRLAPCGLGLGDSERFCRMAGTSPLVESSIGEFMIGSYEDA